MPNNNINSQIIKILDKCCENFISSINIVLNIQEFEDIFANELNDIFNQFDDFTRYSMNLKSKIEITDMNDMMEIYDSIIENISNLSSKINIFWYKTRDCLKFGSVKESYKKW